MANLIGKRVMIVDDASFMRKFLKKILINAHCNVVAEAENGLIAVEEYKKHKPDFVTMDIVMPKMDGISALAAIKEIDANARVFMLSSAGLESMVTKANELGASGFIVKPFKKNDLLDVIGANFLKHPVIKSLKSTTTMPSSEVANSEVASSEIMAPTEVNPIQDKADIAQKIIDRMVLDSVINKSKN